MRKIILLSIGLLLALAPAAAAQPGNADYDQNWLPAPPAGFRMSLRIYLPTAAVLGGAWKPPPVEPVG